MNRKILATACAFMIVYSPCTVYPVPFLHQIYTSASRVPSFCFYAAQQGFIHGKKLSMKHPILCTAAAACITCASAACSKNIRLWAQATLSKLWTYIRHKNIQPKLAYWVSKIKRELSNRSSTPPRAIELSKHEKLEGAGILPYCFVEGQLMFLIGEEGFGPAQGQWAEFGGKRDPNEDPLTTAVREGSEETRNIFGNGNKNKSMNFLRSAITQVVYHRNNRYAIALAKVPYIPANIFKEGAKIDHWEKTDYAWIPAATLLDAMHTSHNVGTKEIRAHIASILKDNSSKLKALQ